MDSEAKVVKCRVRPGSIVHGHLTEGTVFMTTPKLARAMADAKAVDILYFPPPAETKPLEASEKKSSDARLIGPSTDSASLTPAAGPGAASSVSAAGQASTPDNSNGSGSNESEIAAGSSQSTTPTALRPGPMSS